MRFIKLAVISAVVFFLVIFFLSLLIPGHVRISRAANISFELKYVSDLVRDLNRWPEWNEAVKNAGPMTYRGHKLTGKNLEITLTRTTADSVFTVWRNQHGKEIAGVFALQQAGNVTIVQYYFDFHQRWYPWEKFASINLDKQWGPSMEKSLENLEKIFDRAQEVLHSSSIKN